PAHNGRHRRSEWLSQQLRDAHDVRDVREHAVEIDPRVAVAFRRVREVSDAYARFTVSEKPERTQLLLHETSLARVFGQTDRVQLTSVCVFAGSNSGTRPEYRTAATELGRLLATRGVRIVYGGARIGLMGDVANSALGAGGSVTGFMPAHLVN